MPMYNSVQFVAWEVYTGPVHDICGNAIDYAGINLTNNDRRMDFLSQCVDISARVAFTALAIEAAYAAADDDNNVLKIFMAPEFLYRGAGGAYVHDLINGWEEAPVADLPEPYRGAWGGLFGELQEYVADDRFENWLFVFGTAVSAAFEMVDGVVLRAPLDGSEPVSCMNTSLIQCGGSANRNNCYVTQKHLQSEIDFIQICANALQIHYSPVAQPLNPQWISLLDNITVTEGGAVFFFDCIQHLDGNPVLFGIEICLDHACGGETRDYGRLREAEQRVDIQLVPSGGMALQEASVCLLPPEGDREFSYAFNCDGLSSLDNRQYAAHVQLWNQYADGSCNPVAEVNNSFQKNDDTHIPIDELVSVVLNDPEGQQSETLEISGEQLWESLEAFDPQTPNRSLILLRQWPDGSGFVRVLAAQPLDPSGTAVF